MYFFLLAIILSLMCACNAEQSTSSLAFVSSPELEFGNKSCKVAKNGVSRISIIQLKSGWSLSVLNPNICDQNQKSTPSRKKTAAKKFSLADGTSIQTMPTIARPPYTGAAVRPEEIPTDKPVVFLGVHGNKTDFNQWTSGANADFSSSLSDMGYFVVPIDNMGPVELDRYLGDVQTLNPNVFKKDLLTLHYGHGENASGNHVILQDPSDDSPYPVPTATEQLITPFAKRLGGDNKLCVGLFSCHSGIEADNANQPTAYDGNGGPNGKVAVFASAQGDKMAMPAFYSKSGQEDELRIDQTVPELLKLSQQQSGGVTIGNAVERLSAGNGLQDPFYSVETIISPYEPKADMTRFSSDVSAFGPNDRPEYIFTVPKEGQMVNSGGYTGHENQLLFYPTKNSTSPILNAEVNTQDDWTQHIKEQGGTVQEDPNFQYPELEAE